MGGWTPLHLAAMNGHVNVAVALMWGNKEDMLNGADNSVGLATMTGDGSETVSVLVLFCDGSRGVPWRLQLGATRWRAGGVGRRGGRRGRCSRLDAEGAVWCFARGRDGCRCPA